MRALLKAIKYIYWDIYCRQGRYEYLNFFLGFIPGHFGIFLRERFILRYFLKAGTNVKIYPGIQIRGIHNLSVGNNVEIGPYSLINANGGIEIGNNVLIGPNSKIWSVNHVYDNLDVPIANQGFNDKKVIIGNGVWLGAGVVVLPGAVVNEGVIAAAGTVIPDKMIPPYSIIGGNPFRVISFRNKKRYP
jgi:acetyltransferase-like isoleucine patch superfamily enzyme